MELLPNKSHSCSNMPLQHQEFPNTIDPDLTFLEKFDVPDLNPIPNRYTLSPRGPKPITRRLRTSKATTTFLKADAKNFRAVVQKFTGCQRGSPTFGSYKGPINLNFEQCTYYYPNDMEAVKAEAKVEQEQSVDHNKQHDYENNNNNSSINILDEEELLCAVDDVNPRAEALTYEGFDVEEIWRREMSGSGDYTGNMDDGFWEY